MEKMNLEKIENEKVSLKELNDAAVLLTDNSFDAVDMSEFLSDLIIQLSEFYLLALESGKTCWDVDSVHKSIHFMNDIRTRINRAVLEKMREETEE